MANELNPVKVNGPERHEVLPRDPMRDPTPPRADKADFTLAKLADYLAQHGRQQQETTRAFAQQLLDAERRKMEYLEEFCGKLAK